VDQLSSFADEVTRVAREVGTEGKLGGQAQVRGVSGTWRDLTDNVNSMASNLTNQVRNIAMVTTSVARGDLSQKITVDAQGEILALKSTVNTMVDQLSSFADEVTRVAREVGTEGKLGGQAQVRGVSGTWRDLTESVNQLASTLTTQLRAIAQVSTAVTSGDLTQRVAVAARGEVADLKDNINQMIVTLRETTKKNSEQNWLDSNLARIGGLLQGQRDLTEVTRMIITEVAPLVGSQVGAFFVRDAESSVIPGGPPQLRSTASYGYLTHDQELTFEPGEGLVGQAVTSLRTIRVQSAPEGYLAIRSGLGSAPPRDILVLPIVFEGEPLGVIELGSFAVLSELHIAFLERLATNIGVALNTIMANRRTEDLLSQSQRLAREMQEQSAELQRTNAELEEKAELLLEQKRNIEINNREIESARRGLEEKAQQLSLASQYKSEFLANMSHELRTPLNSLLLLSRLLAENSEANLTDKQIEFARVIHRSGSDLLTLIDDILDLSKIEAGRMSVQPADVELSTLRNYVESAFGMQAEDKGLALGVELDAELPTDVVTDPQRLQQILRNLMSNAVKFTHEGAVTLAIAPVTSGLVFGVPSLDTARRVIAFHVRDTGIGIPPEKLAIIFEAFQQADGTTSRKYGGTGLGLSISRELAKLLGGSISATSVPGAGSTFTLYLPDVMPETPPTEYRTDYPGALYEQLTGSNGSGALPVSADPDGRLRRPLPGSMILRGDAPDRRDGPSAIRLDGATVLIVDDDIRNVFALTSALELHGMNVLYSDNGADGIAKVESNPAIDVVLMDAMMPNMDGNETTRAIRAIPRFADLPIVFLTAKAMPGDRDKALEAGASDYITKPVDLDELLDLLAAWVARNPEDSDGNNASNNPNADTADAEGEKMAPRRAIARRGGKK
ncbi:MAG TPA: ATP-binding protein, partial [Sporichthyaceae bacterium]